MTPAPAAGRHRETGKPSVAACGAVAPKGYPPATIDRRQPSLHSSGGLEKRDLPDRRYLALLLGAEQLATGAPSRIMVEFRPRPDMMRRFLSCGNRSIN